MHGGLFLQRSSGVVAAERESSLPARALEQCTFFQSRSTCHFFFFFFFVLQHQYNSVSNKRQHWSLHNSDSIFAVVFKLLFKLQTKYLHLNVNMTVEVCLVLQETCSIVKGDCAYRMIKLLMTHPTENSTPLICCLKEFF